MQSKDPAAGETGARGVAPEAAAPYATPPKGWALLIGVSRYQDDGLNLKHATDDVEALEQVLLAQAGGVFHPDRVRKLVDEHATKANIEDALRSFTQEPAKEDLFLLYYACHGAPDRRRPNVLYLLPHDTDPKNVAGTAVPMREIDLSLRENLLAERVVILADACHSAAVERGMLRGAAANDAEAMNAFLSTLSGARPGVAVLTSAEASETAEEGAQWGGGHGVFTHFVLEGLRGAADGYAGDAKDGWVSVGELFEYVRENVKEATHQRQHPHVGAGTFDRRMPLAVTGATDARLHLERGRRVRDLGLLLNDPTLVELASSSFERSVRLSEHAGAADPEALLELGDALVALGKLDEGLAALSRCAAPGGPPEALLHLGVALAPRHDAEPAKAALRRFAAEHPAHEAAPFAADYAAWLEDVQKGKKRALLIGINEYTAESLADLEGCLNDVRLMRGVLARELGLAPGDIATLTDEGATRDAILAAFERLAREASPADTILVFFSGHSIEGPELGIPVDGDLYLCAHDTRMEGGRLVRGVGAGELHARMAAIPARQKMLVLDTHANERLIERVVADPDYVVLLASSPGKPSMEWDFVVEGEDVHAGALTGCLAAALGARSPQSLTHGALLAEIRKQLDARGIQQEPRFVGDREQLAFRAEDLHHAVWNVAHDKDRGALPLARMRGLYERFRRYIAAPFTSAHAAFGRALLGLGDAAGAGAALAAAVQQGRADLSTVLALGLADLGAGRRDDALTRLREALALAPPEDPDVPLQAAKLALRLGDAATAERAFDRAAAGQGPAACEALFHLGALRACDDEVGSRSALERVLASPPGAADPWMRRWAAWQLGKATPSKIALLIGVAGYAGITPLEGPDHDVRALRDALVGRHGFGPDDVVTLHGRDATRAAVLQALAQLGERALPCDAVVVFYAGYAHCMLREPGAETTYEDVYFPFDAAQLAPPDGAGEPGPPAFERTISGRALHDALLLVPARAKTVFLDPGGPEILELALRDPEAYGLILAASPGEMVYEGYAEGARHVVRGVFSYFLTAQLARAEPAPRTAQELARDVTAAASSAREFERYLIRGEMPPWGDPRARATQAPPSEEALRKTTRRVLARDRRGQTPLFVGDPAHPLFRAGDDPAEYRARGEILRRELLRRRSLDDAARDLLDAVEHAPARAVIALLERLAPRGVAQDPDPEDLVALGAACVVVGDFDRGVACLERAVALLADPGERLRARLGEAAERRLRRAARLHLGRALLASGRNLTRAVSELSAATALDPADARAQYHLGRAIQAMVERETLEKAEAAFRAYLEGGAPLGDEDAVRAFLAARAARRTL